MMDEAMTVRLGTKAIEIRDLIVTELAHFGITDSKMGRAKKHPTISFNVNGKTVNMPIPGTPSDHRSGLNLRSDIAKICRQGGLHRVVKLPTKKIKSKQKRVVEIAAPPASIPESIAIAHDVMDVPTVQQAFWNNAAVRVMGGKPLVYVPRPVTEAVLVIHIEDELVLVPGEALIINLHDGRLHHLPAAQLDAIYRPAPTSASSVHEALTSVMPQKQLAESRLIRRHGVAPQLGRVLLAMAKIQRDHRTNKVDTAALTEQLEEQDRKSLSSQMSIAQKKELVKRIGSIPGNTRAGYYCLTDTGEEVVRNIRSS